MIGEQGQILNCDYEDCDQRISVARKEIGAHWDHPERVLLGKAQRLGWVCSEDGREFYCPDHTISGVKIGTKLS